MPAISAPSVSDHLSLEEVVTRLKSSLLVDGIAEFGSRTTSQISPSSDYDLLVLVETIPARVFQMATTIDGRLADIILVETKTADDLLAAARPPSPRSFEALFAQKIRSAHILYDASGRLHKTKQWVSGETWEDWPSTYPHDPDLYAAWFWQGHGLLHLERMVQSQDPIHQSAVDMMLTSCLSATWRSYFDIRRIAWEGEKAAIRYWAEHDMEYLQTVRKCLGMNDRNEKLVTYRELVERTVEPSGRTLSKGETAVILADSNDSADIQRTLQYWQSLFGS